MTATTNLNLNGKTDDELVTMSQAAEIRIEFGLHAELPGAYETSRQIHAELQRRHNARRDAAELTARMAQMKDAAGEALDALSMALTHISVWEDNAAGSTRFDHLPAEAADELGIAIRAINDTRGRR